MEKVVLAFLKEWLAWAEAGGPEKDIFTRKDGLCHNSLWWSGDDEMYSYLEHELFKDCYPFGESDYEERRFNKTQHECPKRLAWVRAKIAELEAKGTEQ